MERRKSPRKNWVIGKDDVGRAVLEWKVDEYAARRQESDPLAQTYDFLKRLDAPDLELVDDPPPARAPNGCNPYDTGIYRIPKPKRD
jgi:hypothetical protein